MRVAMLSPISWRTPPRAYGPWEWVTSLLTEELVRQGVDVTLFATLDSQTGARLAGVAPRGYSEDASLDPRAWELLHAAHMFERAGEFDVLHCQADFPALAFSRLVEAPIVMTIHGMSAPNILPAFAAYADRAHYVSISDADRHPALAYARTIHHGLRMEDFPFDPVGGEDLLFFGRLHPDKGAAEAIEAARASGRRLHIAGLIQDQAYFDECVAPHIDGERVIYHGLVGASGRAAMLGRAAGLLHLINFDEPFGMSVIEAMACGTPAIAVARGSMPEIIEDGRTGFLVDDVPGAAAAVACLPEIDRAACRAAVAARFTVERMAHDYIALYRDVMSGRAPVQPARLAATARR